MKIGWIGTGVMGLPMAGHLQESSHEIFVFNRTKSRAQPLLQEGAHWCGTPAEVAGRSEILFTIVGLPKDVEEVYLGEKGILSEESPCRIVVDMSTGPPRLALKLAAASAKCGMDSLDAPVSGGDIGAREATLAIMVGGKREVFNKVLPFFRLMGKNIAYMGGPGAGQSTKMCNQILVAGTMIGVCESLLYAAAAGLDQAEVINIIGKGAAGSWSINNLGPRIVRGDYDPGFMVDHFIKDLGIALEEAEALDLSLPGLALAHRLYLTVKEQGHGRSGTQSLILALRDLKDFA